MDTQQPPQGEPAPPPPAGYTPPTYTPPAYGPPAPATPTYAPTAPPRRKGLSCWAWGCIVTLIVVVVLGGGVALCCGGPTAFFGRLFGGYEGMMAISWLQSVQQGDWQTAGPLTVGGESKAKELRQRLEDRVGRLRDSSDLLLAQPAKTTEGSGGAAEVRVPVAGDRGTGTAIFRMKQEGPLWMVEDVSVELAP